MVKKYLDKMKWKYEVIYYVKAFSRNPDYSPKVWEHEGKHGPFYVTDVKVAIYNPGDKQYTTMGNYQFVITKRILKEVEHLVSNDIAFYLVKREEFTEKGKAYGEYKVYTNPDLIGQEEESTPFDEYEGDDEAAFEEDKPPTQHEPVKTIQQTKPIDQGHALVTLKNIERLLEELLNMLGSVLMEMRKDK